MKKPAEESVAVLGVVRNVEGTVARDINRIRKALGGFRQVRFFLVESDSDDETVNTLENLRVSEELFSYVSLGKLRESIPGRAPRIAHCRNRYLDELARNPEFGDVGIVVIADLDGVNDLISREAIESCWERSDWDACFSNSQGPYWDIWALRHPDWNPGDCFAMVRFLDTYSPNHQANLRGSVLQKMIVVPPEADWIRVNSAFGGFGIYKREILDGCEYLGHASDGTEVCEHVSVNIKLDNSGFRLFINPGLLAGTSHEQANALNFFSRNLGRFFKLLRA